MIAILLGVICAFFTYYTVRLLIVTGARQHTRVGGQGAYIGALVFPLHSCDGGLCTCGNPACSSAGKHPRTPHGLKDASTDSAQLWRWWSACVAPTYHRSCDDC